jgi:hypothetical protein
MASPGSDAAVEAVLQHGAAVLFEGATAEDPSRNFRAWTREIIRRQFLHFTSTGRRREAFSGHFRATLRGNLRRLRAGSHGQGDRREMQALRHGREKLPSREPDLQGVPGPLALNRTPCGSVFLSSGGTSVKERDAQQSLMVSAPEILVSVSS